MDQKIRFVSLIYNLKKKSTENPIWIWVKRKLDWGKKIKSFVNQLTLGVKMNKINFMQNSSALVRPSILLEKASPSQDKLQGPAWR